MKRFIYLALCIIALSATSSCNNEYNESVRREQEMKDSLLFDRLDVFQRQLREEAFKLYPTKNMWTFLKLNTATGQVWIVQWNTEDEKRFEYTLDDNVRLKAGQETICGRYILQPTENFYNFILLDQIDGYCWQVQWSIDEDKRFVVPIY